MRRYAGAFAVAALVAACAKTETPEQMDTRIGTESQAARTAIEAAIAEFVVHHNAGHADSLPRFWMENGIMMPANAPTATGREAIRAFFAEGFQMGSYQVALHTQSVSANGPIAIERGRFTLTFTPGRNAPMPAMSDSGRYMTHWHKVGDRWLIAEDLWNSEVPVPAAPAPRRRG